MTPKDTRLFRTQVLEHRAAEPNRHGACLRLAPVRDFWLFSLLVAVGLAAAAVLTVGHLGRYACGSALVRANGRVELTATESGTVSSIDVQPGEGVAMGELLVTLDRHDQAAQLDQIEREIELQTRHFLADPAAAAVRESLITLTAQLEPARARLGARFLRAPCNGVVSDIRVHSGQAVMPGDVVLSMTTGGREFSIVAALPGQYRPLLRTGMPLEIKLDGYPGTVQRVAISAIGEEVIGTDAARRYLGQDTADLLSVTEPVILVRATLDSADFPWNGERHRYFDGMLGRAEVQVRNERIATALIPGLGRLLGESR